MGNLDEIKKKLEENQQIIEMLSLKKQQEEQMRTLADERNANDKDEKENPKYVTKIVAAQEIITYLLKFKMHLFAALGTTIVSIVFAKLSWMLSVFFGFASFVFSFICVKIINDSQKYLMVKYKLPGHEKYEKKQLTPEELKKKQTKSNETENKLNTFFGS